MFLTFFGEPRDKHVYDHCHQEHIGVSNIPLLILAVFTFGFWFSGAMFGSWVSIFPKGAQEWFQVLVEAPKVEKFVDRPREEFSFVDTRTNLTSVKSEYTHQPTYAGPNMDDEHDEHHLHSIHLFGAIASILIAGFGIFIAFMMYIKKGMDPAKWVAAFPRWNKALHNKYYMDDFYIGVVIEKGLLRLNKLLAYIDMGLYDRYAIDGWKNVTQVFFKTSHWFDRVIIDKIAVDGNGFAVNLFNFVLRGIQNGRVQFYFVTLIFVLVSYVWSLNL